MADISMNDDDYDHGDDDENVGVNRENWKRNPELKKCLRSSPPSL